MMSTTAQQLARDRVGARITGSETTSTSRLRSSIPETANDDLRHRLVADLWARLPIARLDPSRPMSIEQITRIAGNSHSQVVSWYADLTQLAREVARAAVAPVGGEELSAEFFEKLHRDVEREILDRTKLPLPPQSFVDYRFADRPPTEAAQFAERKLAELCNRFVAELFQFMQGLQQQGILGVVRRGDATCQFSFYRRVVMLDTKKEVERRTTRTVVDPLTANSPHPLLVTSQYSGEVTATHRDAIHTHDVNQAEFRSLGNTQNPVPKKYQRLADSCPDWMQPYLRVVEGDLFRERRVEKDMRTESRPNEQLISTWVSCPGLLFGDFVLAGWNDEAIKAESAPPAHRPNGAWHWWTSNLRAGQFALALLVGFASLLMAAFLGDMLMLRMAAMIMASLATMITMRADHRVRETEFRWTLESHARAAVLACGLFATQTAIALGVHHAWGTGGVCAALSAAAGFTAAHAFAMTRSSRS